MSNFLEQVNSIADEHGMNAMDILIRTMSHKDFAYMIHHDGNLPPAGKTIAEAILASVSRNWTSDNEFNVKQQGNWPVTAEFAVREVINDRGNNNHDCSSIKFFDSEDQLNEYLDAAQRFYPGSDFSCCLYIYGWDLGPEYLRMMYLN